MRQLQVLVVLNGGVVEEVLYDGVERPAVTVYDKENGDLYKPEVKWDDAVSRIDLT